MRVVSQLNACGRVGYRCRTILALVVLALAMAGCHRNTSAGRAEPGQTTFATPEAAAKALVEAAQSGDQQQLLDVLGPSVKDILFTGDAAEDKADMTGFTSAYMEMNRWRRLENGDQILLVGATNTAFPVPLRKDHKGEWYFDTPAGATELQVRRIGRNELATIDILASLADAQEEYFSQAHEGTKQYARHFISDAGKQDGLYWPPVAGSPRSPVGPALAYATEQGNTLNPSLHKPYHGYYYGVLVTQGLFANGGLKDYMREGKMTRGYGFIAWPAEYGKSGIMTFIINGDRIVFQKDLGKTTKDQAPFTTAFAPDGSWIRVEQ